MLKEGENKDVESEYEKLKRKEDEYLEGKEFSYDIEGKKSRDWIYWFVTFIVVISFVGFTVNRMSNSAGEIVETQEISRMTAQEAVDHLYDEDGQWIRRNLTMGEYEQVAEKVDELEESSKKVHIKVKLDEAKVQLDSQITALELIEDLKTSEGFVNIDLDRSILDKEEKDFPDKYNPEYVEELRLEYKELIVVIRDSYDVQDKVVELGNKTGQYIDGNELSVLVSRVEGLPKSKKKERLERDIKMLKEIYEEQQEELRIKEAEERARLKEEEIRQQRINEEKERIRQKELEEERQRQERIEEERKMQEERERESKARQDAVIKEQEEIERQEKERIDKENREIEEERIRREQELEESTGNDGDSSGVNEDGEE